MRDDIDTEYASRPVPRLPYPKPKAFGEAVANALVLGFARQSDNGTYWQGHHPALGDLTIRRDRFTAPEAAGSGRGVKGRK